MVFWPPPNPWYIFIVYRIDCLWHIETTCYDIYMTPYKWDTSIEPHGYGIWPPTDGIETLCLWYIDPLAKYFDPSTHGIPNPYGILGSLIMVYRTPCLLYVDLFALGISNSLFMAFWPLTTHRISKHLPIGYQTLYQWYIEPPAYGISPS